MENNNGKFMSGFIWGAIIGGGLVFLLSTKKGKKILKMLSVEGLESVSKLLENNEEESIDEDDEELTEKDSIGGEPIKKPVNGNGHKPLRRFFKGISKKF